jgi:hypothetical protein
MLTADGYIQTHLSPPDFCMKNSQKGFAVGGKPPDSEECRPFRTNLVLRRRSRLKQRSNYRIILANITRIHKRKITAAQ